MRLEVISGDEKTTSGVKDILKNCIMKDLQGTGLSKDLRMWS